MCLPVQGSIETIKELGSTFETSESLPSTKTERCQTAILGYYTRVIGTPVSSAAELMTGKDFTGISGSDSHQGSTGREAFAGYELPVTS